MQTLYEIIKLLEATPGNNDKLAILEANKDNELLREFVKATLDPAINYYQSKLPKDGVSSPLGPKSFEMLDLEMLSSLSQRKYTGHEAQAYFSGHVSTLNAEARELMAILISGKLGKTKVGDTMALKVWPGLFFVPPYQRCSLLDDKAKAHFGKLKRFYVQTKLDGTFAYVVKRKDGTVDVITRQGNTYPQWFAEQMAQGLAAGTVLIGELMLDRYLEGGNNVLAPIDRKTANGIFNSLQKDGEGFDPQIHRATLTAWDMLTQEEFESRRSVRMYMDRFQTLRNFHFLQAGTNFSVVDCWEVTSLAEAYAIYTDHTSRGLEGCIISDPESLWKDNTAKDRVKMKLKFAVEMLCTGIYEGEGKAAGTMGGGYFRSKDGGIKNKCGSGFDDKQREMFWKHPDLIVDHVCELEANDITQARDGNKEPSLSLPIFCQVRYDKTEADTTERIYQQLEAAKQGGN